jgi:hypothetical protein
MRAVEEKTLKSWGVIAQDMLIDCHSSPLMPKWHVSLYLSIGLLQRDAHVASRQNRDRKTLRLNKRTNVFCKYITSRCFQFRVVLSFLDPPFKHYRSVAFSHCLRTWTLSRHIEFPCSITAQLLTVVNDGTITTFSSWSYSPLVGARHYCTHNPSSRPYRTCRLTVR